jgi:hypothetical protein
VDEEDSIYIHTHFLGIDANIHYFFVKLFYNNFRSPLPPLIRGVPIGGGITLIRGVPIGGGITLIRGVPIGGGI